MCASGQTTITTGWHRIRRSRQRCPSHPLCSDKATFMSFIFSTLSTVLQGRRAPSQMPPLLMGQPVLAQPEPGIDDSPTSSGFIALLMAFRASGGTARSGDVNRLLDDHHLSHHYTLETLVAEEQVFGFAWRDTLWIPMLQFDLADLTLKRGPQQVAAELRSQFDGWQLAAWFARPNGWLDGHKPVDVIDSKLAEVLDAARVDRFVAAG